MTKAQATPDPDPFTRLSPTQQAALCSVAFGGSGSGFPRKTLESLEARGLITAVVHQSRDRLGSFTWSDYMMPIGVHIDFCEWCAARDHD